MNANIPVTCLLDRSWNPVSREFEGTQYSGELIGITTETSEDHSGKLVCVGIVVLDNGTVHSVPISFIKKLHQD